MEAADTRARAAVAALVAVRVAIPLGVLAASGHALPLVPRYTYGPLSGDATGFYAAAREFVSAPAHLGALRAVAVVLVASATVLAVLRTRGWFRPVAGALGLATAVAIVVTALSPPGAAVFGWPLLWSVPMFPARAAGVLDQDVAFAFGLSFSLTANAATVVATYLIGLRATGRRAVGIGAAALFALWPLLSGIVAGHRGWLNGTWTIDAGLHLYTEPLSTALVTGAIAALLSPRLTHLRLALAGIAFSYATLVKLSNGFLAAFCLLALGASRGLPFLAGGLTFVPAIGAYWPKGYVPIFDNPEAFPAHPFALDYFGPNWHHSFLFSPRTLAVLVPVAVLGGFAARGRFALVLLAGPVLVNALFYSFYRNTQEHPRFLFVSLPAVLVLWAAGVSLALRKASGGKPGAPLSSPP